MPIGLIIIRRREGVSGEVDEMLVDAVERILQGLVVIIDVADNVRQTI